MTGASGDRASRPTALLSRRAVLTGLTATVIACAATACGHTSKVAGASRSTSGPGAGPTSAGAADDVALVTAAIASEERLGSYYTAAANRFAVEAVQLTDSAGRQRAHVNRLRDVLVNVDPPVAQGHEDLPRRAADLDPAIADIAGRARAARGADCLNASAGALAALFASMAAAHAVTVLEVEPAQASTVVAWPDTVVDAAKLQPCLAAEHAAVYGYGVLGGVLSAGVSDAPIAATAVSSYDAHRERRDRLTDLIAGARLTPVAAEATYELPFPVSAAPSARRLASYLEGRCSSTYAAATAATATEARLLVSDILVDTACRAVRWGARPTAFPGLGVT